MTRKCKITILNEVDARVEGLDPNTNRKCVDKLKFLLPYRFHVAAYKLGRWDGAKKFFDESGKTYNNVLSDIVPIIANEGYEFEFEDKRYKVVKDIPLIDENIFSDHLWPEGHFLEGQPIVLRSDQVECINVFAKHRHAIEVLATGFGKCLSYHTKIPIYTRSPELAKLLNIETFERTDIEIGYLVNKLDKTNEYNNPIKVEEELSAYDEFNNKIKIHNVIRKRDSGIKFTFDNGADITTSIKHYFRHKGHAISALEVAMNKTAIDTRGGFVSPEHCEAMDNMDFFDIEVDDPHWYIDTNNIIHHNTIFTAALCKIVEDQGRTLTIVPSKSLVEQTAEDFRLVGMDVGVFYGDKKEIGHKHTISTWQSLDNLIKNRKSNLELYHEMIDELIQVNVDEAHSAKASALETILCDHLKNVPIRRGFTGTIPREAYDAKTLQASIGSVVKRVTAKELQDKGILSNCHIKAIVTKENQKFTNYDLEVSFLSNDPIRLQFINEYIQKISKTGNTLVLVNYVDMGKELKEMIPDSEFVYGQTKMSKRSEIYKSIQNSTNSVVIATYPVAAVGLNIPRIFNVVLIDAGKSFVRVIQTIGRGIRIAKDKNFAQIHDISSDCKYSKKHLKVRKEYYEEAEYPYEAIEGDYDKILDKIEDHLDE